MSYPNGQIPAEALRPCDGTPGAVLLPVQAASWNAVRAEVHRRHGWWPTITSAGDAYRDLDRQIKLFRRHFTTTYAASTRTDRRVWNGQTWWRRPGFPSAATPGNSNHGKGVTVDVTGLGDFDSRRHAEFSQVAEAYGWSDAEGRSIGEPWHWNGHSAIAPAGNTGGRPGGALPDVDITPVTPIEEDDMSAAGEAAILAALSNITALLATERDRSDGQGGGIRRDVLDVGRAVAGVRADVGTVANELRAGLISLGQQIRSGGVTTVDARAIATSLADLLGPELARDVVDELQARLSRPSGA